MRKVSATYQIKEDEQAYYWSEKMLEPVITKFDKVKEMMSINDVGGYSTPFCKAIHKMRKETDCYDRTCDECKEWLKQPYEESKEILDETEKKYLGNIIKPFRNKVNYIEKKPRGSLEYICMYLGNGVLGSQGDGVFLPYFEKNSMYKGMKPGKEYSLEELGL